jgi:hypothetical protein
MNDKQRRRFERLVRISDYGEANAGSFPKESIGGIALVNIKAVITEIENLDASRNTGATKVKQATGIKQETRASLRAQLSAINRTAKTIALDMPEFKDKFRVPVGGVSDQTLLGVARSIADEALPFKDKFIEYGMTADFLDTLKSGLTAFERAVNQQNTGAGARTSALSAIDAALKRGESEVERLDTIILNKFRADPATLAAWQSAQHLERAPKTKAAASKPPAPPTP